MKYRLAVFGLVVYFILLISVYLFYINIFNVDVVFFGSIYSALCALLVYSILLSVLPIFSLLNGFDKFNMIIVAALFGYVLAISVPTVIDRSLSFYILEKLQQRGGGIKLSSFEYIFTNEYVKEHKLVDIRLTEQEHSGTILIEGDCVFLTEKGDFLANMSRGFRKYFLPKKRLLRGRYTDDLIDPFSRSDEVADYKCN